MGTHSGMRPTASARIELDDERHCADFIRLNEQWIAEFFAIEEGDRTLAADPFRVVREGGHLLALVLAERVIGVCALFREGPDRLQLARMAVEPAERGQGYGEMLIEAALQIARESGATSIYLLSNTVLVPAIALYRKHGFITVAEGPHPVYARSNIVMELRL